MVCANLVGSPHTDCQFLVNFVGPRDEYVVSGSDDGELLFICLATITVESGIWAGNFFIWDKVSGELLDIHEGDESVVNVVCLGYSELWTWTNVLIRSSSIRRSPFLLSVVLIIP